MVAFLHIVRMSKFDVYKDPVIWLMLMNKFFQMCTLQPLRNQKKEVKESGGMKYYWAVIFIVQLIAWGFKIANYNVN